MKKSFKLFLITVLCIISILPINTFAINEITGSEVYSIDLTESEIQRIIDENIQTNQEARATGLILYYYAAVEKSGTKLNVAAKIECASAVKKCGFKKLVIQRRTSSNASWSNYITYEDLYADSFTHAVGKTITPPTGYQYRAVCTFYAKKNILSTQKIEFNTNIVTF